MNKPERRKLQIHVFFSWKRWIMLEIMCRRFYSASQPVLVCKVHKTDTRGQMSYSLWQCSRNRKLKYTHQPKDMKLTFAWRVNFFTFYFFWFFLSHRMKNVHRILLWWASGLLEAAIYYTHFNLRRVVCGGNYVEGEEGVCLVKMREGKYDSAKITGKEQVLKP